MIIKHRTPRQASQSEWQARLEAIRKAPRVVVFALLILVAFIVFSYRLWNLQIVEGQHYQVKADEQRLHLQVIPAARGVIYSHDGTSLVHNVPSFNAVVIPAYLPDYDVTLPSFTPYTPDDIQVTFSPEAEAVLLRLAVLLDMPYATDGKDGEPGVQELVTSGTQRGYVYRSVVVKKRVERDIALLIASEGLTLPGVDVELDSRREYLYGALVSQVLGYTSPIPSASADEYKELGYDPDTDRVGVSGVEAVYEDALRGQKGEQLVEADVQGRVIRVVEKEADPMPGGNVYLTLDLDLQQFTQEALLRGMARAGSPRGVALVMQPQTGEILAMVSLPTYDNNLFAKGI